MAIRLLLVDDHTAIADALGSALRAAGFDPVDVVAPDALHIGGVLDAAARAEPDVALVDLNLGHGRSGVPLIAALAKAGTRVVALTARDDELAVAAVVDAGAAGLLNKSEAFDTIVSNVRRVAAGEQLLSVARRAELVELAQSTRTTVDDRLVRFASLSPREATVLGNLLEGRSAKDIAAVQGVAVRTVRSQIEAVRRKLGVPSQLAAVALAREIGWAPPD